MQVALVHTVQSVLSTFENKVREALGEVKITNTFDDYLASDPGQKGEFTIDNLNRLYMILRCAEMADPDAIVVTCSTLSPEVEKLKPFIKVPLIAIDEAMVTKAAGIGGRITVMATAECAVGPVTSAITREAQKLGTEIHLSVKLCSEAFIALKSGDIKTHDELVKERALEIKGQDVVVLAQASMAHLEEQLEKVCGCTVLSSPKLCISQLKEVLKSVGNSSSKI